MALGKAPDPGITVPVPGVPDRDTVLDTTSNVGRNVAGALAVVIVAAILIALVRQIGWKGIALVMALVLIAVIGVMK